MMDPHPPSQQSPRRAAKFRWIIGGCVSLVLLVMTWLGTLSGPFGRGLTAIVLAGGIGSLAFLEGRGILFKGLGLPERSGITTVALALAWAVWIVAVFAPSWVLPISLVALFGFTLVGFTAPARNVIQAVGVEVLGFVWIVLPIASGLDIWTAQSAGPLWITWLALIVKGADTAAYLVGPRWGQRPFFTAISPKKTLEGFVAALAFGAAAGAFGMWLFELGSLWLGCVLGLSLACAGAFGDLAESAFKRQANVKDSGKLPGIGGALDICDALLVGLPLLWTFLRFGSHGV